MSKAFIIAFVAAVAVIGVLIWIGRISVWLAQALTECGRLDVAASLIADLPEFQEAEEINSRFYTVIEFHLAKGDIDEARRLIRRCLPSVAG